MDGEGGWGATYFWYVLCMRLRDSEFANIGIRKRNESLHDDSFFVVDFDDTMATGEGVQ
jgi:hypothetical protein